MKIFYIFKLQKEKTKNRNIFVPLKEINYLKNGNNYQKKRNLNIKKLKAIIRDI
jgi:hypothetical protein